MSTRSDIKSELGRKEGGHVGASRTLMGWWELWDRWGGRVRGGMTTRVRRVNAAH